MVVPWLYPHLELCQLCYPCSICPLTVSVLPFIVLSLLYAHVKPFGGHLKELVCPGGGCSTSAAGGVQKDAAHLESQQRTTQHKNVSFWKDKPCTRCRRHGFGCTEPHCETSSSRQGNSKWFAVFLNLVVDATHYASMSHSEEGKGH